MGYRVEGAGAFGFSLNWVKVAGDDEVARRVIIMLEDRRLLFGPRHAEDEMECVRSAEQIRRELTRELAEARPGASLASSLRAIRAACRRFMEAAGPGARYFHHRSPWGAALAGRPPRRSNRRRVQPRSRRRVVADTPASGRRR